MADKKTAGIGRGTPGPGRPAGRPNNATATVRAAFERLVESNAPAMQKWLEATAEKDPGEALALLAKLAEFIVPKPSRSELRGADGSGELVIRIVRQGDTTPPEATP